MKALVYTGTNALEVRDEPMPDPDPDQVLVQVQAAGICGSDMHAYLGHDERRPAPLILGHEAAGLVMSGPDEGRRVTINPLVPCGDCRACRSGRENLCGKRQIISMPPRQGAFAQYVAMRPENLVTVPDAVSFQVASLAEPLACGWHAVRLASQARPGGVSDATCVVLGGGAIGLGAALSLAAFGAHDIHIAETNALRHPALEAAGPFRVFDPTGDRPVADGAADIVIDGVGLAATRKAASRLACPGGVIVHIGLGDSEGGLDIRRMTLQEITFIGSYTYTAQDFRDTAAAIFDGRLGRLDWIEPRPLADGLQAFRDIHEGRAAAPKIVLTPF